MWPDVLGIGCVGLFVPTNVSGNTIGAAEPKGCVTFLLSWVYHRIPAFRSHGFEQQRFPLVERWIDYEPLRDREETRLRG
ncbi:hypothetical protein PIB30_069635 [Stylosanthes scabra]|uniref:Uncharacterized protein n=1 Tax=Stylosanthes scabra TaxID=79078 RepID=A0ABU6SNB1_9FABA|nr:hypothetical protein [Stylosanthes scabra]